MLIAVPAALLASTAASGRIRGTARQETETGLNEGNSSEAAVTMEAPDVPISMQATSPLEHQISTERKYRTHPRFTLEDDEAIRKALRCQCPPVGEASLNSGLSVEVASW